MSVGKAMVRGMQPIAAGALHSKLHYREYEMAKGEQRSNKMVKKPKKDTSAPVLNTAVDSNRPIAPVTSVMPKGKLKNK